MLTGTFPSLPVVGKCPVLSSEETSYPPINYVYKHLHDSIRFELRNLTDLVHTTEAKATNEDVSNDLLVLRERYNLLAQINRYHSSVEDEVVYPALELKVRNVTHPYSVEHGEEDLLLGSLQALLDAAINATGETREDIIHELVCKVDEVHVTMRKHLRKEEEQLFPLVLQHFSFQEQAELVVQFICCIPVIQVRNVLGWLCKAVCNAEQLSLLNHMRVLCMDPHLCRLVTLWMEVPSAQASPSIPHVDPSDLQPAFKCTTAFASCSPLLVPPHSCYSSDTACSHVSLSSSPNTPASDPLNLLLFLRRGILHSLHAFEAELNALHTHGHVSVSQLNALLLRWQFLCAMSAFHRLSEDQFIFPMARSLSFGDTVCFDCEEEHLEEARTLTALGRLLSDLESSSRRGAGNIPEILRALIDTASAVAAAMQAQTLREERDLLPALAHQLPEAAKRSLVWQTLQVLPLRLLERAVPWLALQIGSHAVAELMQHELHGSDPATDTVLIQLFSKWAQRAFAGPPPHPAMGATAEFDLYCAFPTATCAPSVVCLSPSQQRHTPLIPSCCGGGAKKRKVRSTDGVTAERKRVHPVPANTPRLDESACATMPSPSCSRSGSSSRCVEGDLQMTSAPVSTVAADSTSANPIDHIFQFHKALRRELHQIEIQAKNLQSTTLQEAEPQAFRLPLQRLEGRFLFVAGIYQAHSMSEDEVVFPALEAKQSLKNVSTFYVLDHQQETQLFAELGAIIENLQEMVRSTDTGSGVAEEGESRSASYFQQRAGLVSRLRQKCASVRASLETHVRAEEAEIWPLFAEHFTVEEQSELVGTIIGRTGAVVLQALIPWVMGSFSDDEKGAMINSLRKATQNTHFDKWMDAMVPGDLADDLFLSDMALGLPEEGPGGGGGVPGWVDDSAVRAAPLLSEAQAEQKAVADTTAYCPGWNDIFRMNASQLEVAATTCTSSFPGEEEHRKKYLAHHLIVSRFLIAQQQRMRMQARAPGAAAAAPPPLRTPEAAGARMPCTTTAAGCVHYRTLCTQFSPCCGKEVACRLCHDELNVCCKPFDRYAVKEMRCKLCNTRQPVAGQCSNCQATMAHYYCSVCHLFDDDKDRHIYHCPFCNMCRRGKGLGIDSFHCMRCNACMSLELFNKHTCRERAMESNCPICHENLFASALPVKELPCGHFMHSGCFAEYTQHRYTCPICCKSVGDLRLYFQMLDRLLMDEKMPPELQDIQQSIHCNDCSNQSKVPYHFVYHKCPSCASYNTRVM